MAINNVVVGTLQQVREKLSREPAGDVSELMKQINDNVSKHQHQQVRVVHSEHTIKLNRPKRWTSVLS